MAQRKSPPVGKSAAKKGPARPAGKPAGASPSKAGAPRKPPPRKPGKSIVNQKQRPWGLIWSTIAVLAFAGAVIGVVVATHKSSNSAGGGNGNCTAMIGSNPVTYLNELQCAKQIKGVTFRPEANRNHEVGSITYDASPPVGGNHSPYWVDCTGTVYDNPIASENAVHGLEHGAVWVTYRPGLPAVQVAELTGLVAGQDRMFMSPYPGLKSAISLQSWGYQLFVNSPNDPRIRTFITDLRYNPKTTPEYGATCSQPTFKQHPSTFGHPLAAPANGAAGNTMAPSTTAPSKTASSKP
jgi:hypothetical protein